MLPGYGWWQVKSGLSLDAVEQADEMLSQVGWVSALIEASVKSGELNRRAAKWTAVAVLLGTISSVLSNWS
ncbi:MAG: hypothetical protein ACRD22_01960 [Terriglobia bacterium]